ncbi:hypothetical protein GLOIN_2v1765153 [Rhizophagus irregularis DAOM 181602=DAOM 197198]|nr:hypothetical protein GLOIN_2v1765153 [Rhizophagus irregularis DAOM 181602=DAOM 197198]
MVPKKQMDKQRQKPTLIDFVEDEERNIGIFRYIYIIMPEFIISPNDYEFKVLNKKKRTKRRQSELMKGQKGRKFSVIDLVDDDDDDPIQQDERDNDQTNIVLGAGRRIESVDPENNERKEPIQRNCRIMDRLPEDKALNTRKTFDSQQKLVENNIIPVVQKMINKNIFSVSDGVIKHIVHERHRYQRELLLNSERDANWKDLKKRRKHANSRQSDLRSFLRNYVDNAASNAQRVRKRVYDTEYAPNEYSAPVNAPKWAKVGYKGLLKHLVKKYSANREEVEDDKSQEDDDATGGEKNEDQEKEQDEEVDNRKKRKKRSISLVSEEYDSSDSSKSVG